jgi:cytochrome c-type biogenesis protein CcmE
MLKTQTKIYRFLLLALLIGSGIGLMLYGASNNITFFYTPRMIDVNTIGDKIFRMGGIVKTGSIKYDDINSITFIVTDGHAEIETKYKGMIPKLFRDEQGVVLKGKLKNGQFIASEILAKHDETYYPPS